MSSIMRPRPVWPGMAKTAPAGNSEPPWRHRNIPTLGEWTTHHGASRKLEDDRIVLGIRFYHAATEEFARFAALKVLWEGTNKVWQAGNTCLDDAPSTLRAEGRVETLKRAVAAMPLDMDQRERCLNALYLSVVSKLCAIFKAPEVALPRKLQEVVGMVGGMQHPGEELEYLDALGREEFRLEFKGGKAQRWNGQLADTRSGTLAIADTSGADAPDDYRTISRAGFVMVLRKGVWDALYMRKHGGDVFHSSYTAGNPVRCAGEMAIEAGTIKMVSNLSGHYQPEAKVLLQVLWHLQRNGVVLDEVAVYAMRDESRALGVEVEWEFYEWRNGMEFLRNGGRIVEYDRCWTMAPDQEDWVLRYP
jgi:hypothetical protein